jgi:antitoxin component YwqK of YwqJK toxin-antitoxin module
MTKKNHLIEHWPNGNKKREGFYKDYANKPYGVNDKHGVWTSWYENGQKKAEINHAYGCRDGWASSWYENGELASTAPYTNGHLDGYVSSWYEDGKQAFQGEYACGETGEWKAWFKNGQLKYQGYFWNHFSHSGHFEHGDYDAVEEKYNYEEWMDDDDVLDDEWEESWHDTSIDFWWDDFGDGREGTWTSWYENGQKKSEINYKDYDELQIPEGLPIYELEGTAMEWYENGQVKSEGSYAENCKIGKFREWYESGWIKSITLYLNWIDYPEPYDDSYWCQELKDGKCIIFDEEGEIRSEEYFIKGKLIESNEYPIIDD